MYNTPHITQVLATAKQQELQDDPYPTAIESVAVIFAAAISQDACGGSEPAILGKMYAAMYKVLADEDPASLHLLVQP
jgi:hypothetical protein